MFYTRMDELVYLTHSTDLVLITEEFDAVLAQLGIEHVAKAAVRWPLWHADTTPEVALILMRVGQAGHSVLKIKLSAYPTVKSANEGDSMNVWTSSLYPVPEPLVLHGPKEALNKLVRRLVAAEQATASGDKSTDTMVDKRGRQITNYSRSLGLTQVEGVQHGRAGGLTVNPPQVYAPTMPTPQA